jgi:hypothetical protein
MARSLAAFSEDAQAAELESANARTPPGRAGQPAQRFPAPVPGEREKRSHEP